MTVVMAQTAASIARLFRNPQTADAAVQWTALWAGEAASEQHFFLER